MKSPVFLILLSLVFVLPLKIQAQSAQAVMGARAIGLSQAVTALPDYEWNVFFNPAMMSQEGRHASFFAMRYYDISELTDYGLAATYATDYGTAGVGLHTYGFDLYRESRYRLAYMNEFYNIRVGLAANMTHLSIHDFGSDVGFALDIGVAYNIFDNLILGAKFSNINRGTIGEVEEELPRDMAIGISYTLSDRALFVSDVYKDIDFDFSYRGGVEIHIIEILRARAGITTNPQTLSFGFGYVSSLIRADIAVQRHDVLGWSPGLDFAVTW